MSYAPEALLPRPAATVRQETEELRDYLSGLPAEWSSSGSFLGYEERLKALERELALSQVVNR
jgi:hypothetical protein